MRALEGWPRRVALHATADVRRAARAVGRGGKCVPAPTWPEGPKEGSRRPALHGDPWRPVGCGLGAARRLAVSDCLARRYAGAVASHRTARSARP
jgi:hypothetical protein